MKILIGLLSVVLLNFAAPARAEVQDDIRMLFNQFVRESNAHNVAAVGQLLQDSNDFYWIPPHGAPVLGRDAALQQLTGTFRGAWRIEPDMAALKITALCDSAARLQVPARYTVGDGITAANSMNCILTQVYIKTAIGWRISSIVPVPQKL
jgi:ketosteroid isomerase-like protein